MEYDVFISCKSEDYQYAEKVYDFLKENDIKSFLASKELRQLGESAYRKEISKALKSAVHLIVLASKAEFVESKWVEYEWDTYLSALLNGYKEGGQIMTILDNTDIHDLPMDLWKYESFTFDNYRNNILSYVDTPAAEQRRLAKKEKQLQDAEEKLRKEKILREIQDKESEYKRLCLLIGNIGGEIVMKKKSLGMIEKECPVCSSVNPIEGVFCQRCGWVFDSVVDSGSDSYQRHLLLSKSNWTALKSTENKDESKIETDIIPDIKENTVQIEPERKVFLVDGIKFNMIHVKAGSFMMGAAKDEMDSQSNERPQHKVTLTENFFIGETPVTQELWTAIMGGNPTNDKGNMLPVRKVSWIECTLFIEKLNKKTGQNFRLPTEAEWEFAAKGGNNSKGYKYSGSDNIEDVAWYLGWLKGNSGGKTHDVATMHPNELGIYDMSGNVSEWCQDMYGEKYYGFSASVNPCGEAKSKYRVFRGGSCIDADKYCRSSYRGHARPDDKPDYIGFRLLLAE